MSLTILGLGAANPDALTLGALALLRRPDVVRLARARRHPVAVWLESSFGSGPGGVRFDEAFDDEPDADAIVQRVLTRCGNADVVFAVPGHPLFGDPSGVKLWLECRARNLPVSLLPAAPSASSPGDFDALVSLMARLRDPESGCPWDREQTPQSLRKYAIEEAYEVVEAIDGGSADKWREELGDLLLQVVFHAQLAQEEGKFDVGNVTQTIVEKLVRRHPHVFGSVQVSGSEDVLTNWQQIKRAEPGYEDRKSVLDGIPIGLPALMRAQELSKRAVKVGFEWPGIAEILDKVDEELAELRVEIAAGDTARTASELGDLLFTLVNVARKLDVDAEDALWQMTQRFSARFRHIEAHAEATGRSVSDLSLEEMEAVWQKAKRATA